MDSAELRKLVKELQTIAQSGKTEDAVNILKRLKKEVNATEELLRETKAGLAIGKLRTHAAKEVADIAKELVKKWKEQVEAGKKARAAANGASAGDSNGVGTPNVKPTIKKQLSVVTSTDASKPGSPQTQTTRLPDPPRTQSRRVSIVKTEQIKTEQLPIKAESIASPSNSQPPSTPILRSAALDNIKIETTGDKTRDACVKMLYDSLAVDSGSPSELILGRAASIEEYVLQEFGGTTKDYKNKIRRLYLNLKEPKNPGLRVDVVAGDLDVSKFCGMSSEDMASDERKRANDAINMQNLHNAQGADDPEAETDAFQCGRCKQRKTKYRQAQTRSADEPMTTFVSCVVCGNKWKFC